MNKLFLVFISLLITSCISQKEKPDTVLKTNEGFVLMNIDCPSVIKKVHILRSGRTANLLSEYSPDMRLACSEVLGENRNGLAFFKLKQGAYFFGTVGAVTSLYFDEANAYKFNVVSGKINYIGDFKIDYLGDSYSNVGLLKKITQNISVDVENGKAKTIPKFSSEYPDLYKNTPINIEVAKK